MSVDAPDDPALPALGTVERWAWDYILTDVLAHKLDPPAPPDSFEAHPPPRRLSKPGRPRELTISTRAEKVRGLASSRGRARAFHTFLHHELQAAELMAWAILAFPDTPEPFRRGLVRILLDETRHMRLYAAQLERLGARFGDFTVRDWFWERVPSCPTPASFVAVMGLGFESANLEHAASFAARFRAVGDDEGASVQELVGREEVAHVRFGATWFRHFTGDLSFETWARALPAPLSPMLMHGSPLQPEVRRRAGQPDSFIEELSAWKPLPPGS